MRAALFTLRVYDRHLLDPARERGLNPPGTELAHERARELGRLLQLVLKNNFEVALPVPSHDLAHVPFVHPNRQLDHAALFQVEENLRRGY